MAKRERRQPEPGEFEDPLSNYDGPEYTDEFERSLSEDPLTVIEHRPYLAVVRTQTVTSTLRLMAENNAACVVVINDQTVPVGIFSERDVMIRVAENLPAIGENTIDSVMTPDPQVVHSSASPAMVLNVMASHNVRHVPLVDADGKLLGVIGARRLTAYLQYHFPDAAAK